MSESARPPTGPQRVAVVIPARNDRDTIAPTVRACRAIPSVDLIIVVDDGSDDDTAQVARGAGAVVVRHSVARGRGSAVETGTKVVAMRDRSDWPARYILIMEPDLGDSAIEATALVETVNEGVADLASGTSPSRERTIAERRADKSAARAIKRQTGWDVTEPFADARCITREAVNAISPFFGGWGVDVAATIDLISKGFSVVEVPCDFEPMELPSGSRSPWRTPKRSDIWFASQSRRFRGDKLSGGDRVPDDQQAVGTPYPMSANERRAHDLKAETE